MTNVIVNAIDVLGQEIDEGVVRISAADAQYNGGLLMLPEYHEQELVAGSTTITGVTSGKVVVTIYWDINRTATFRVYVPDTTEITLAELALQKYDSDPAVVSKVADAALRAEDAADRAEDVAEDFGSLEAVTGLVQSATDAASSASGSASAASSSASAAATSESNAAGSASSAGTSASSAASSASAAAGSASTASGAAASAAGSESQAASSATAAASSASAAASSASTAEDAAERAEAGATTVGDAQAILAARDQAVTAKDGAVTAQTAAEAAATSAASAAATEVNKLKAGAPEAFDTLLEIANELGENETERAALANTIATKAEKVYVDGELDKKADADHTHTAAQISDATATGRSVLTASSQAAARTAIGAGTSNLALGTTASTAKAGNYQPTAANISDATAVGRNVLKATDAAAARSAIGAGTSDLALGTTSSTAAAGNHTHTGYATTAQVNAKVTGVGITAIEAVTVMPGTPNPTTLYIVKAS